MYLHFDSRVNRMEAETDTGRQPGHLRKNGNKKRQISAMENWRNKNDYDSSVLVGMIMLIGSHISPEEGQGFF